MRQIVKLLIVLTGIQIFQLLYAQDVLVINITPGWRFSPDPEGIGSEEGWYSPEFNPDDWKIIDGGLSWEEQGFPDYDGISWYRKLITVPHNWQGKNVYALFGGVHDYFELYINGERIGSYGSPDNIMAENRVVTDVGRYIRVGKGNLFALKVINVEGKGGLVGGHYAISPDQELLGGSTYSLRSDWKFKTDPSAVGKSEGWMMVDFDDTLWNSINVGVIWENQGYQGYDGYAWYRKRFKLPDYWGDNDLFLIFGGVDDIYDLYVNGKRVKSYGNLEDNVSVWNTVTITDITEFIERKAENLISLRVYDWGGGGGISFLPAVLSTTEGYMKLTRKDYVKLKAEKEPGLLWPHWIAGKGKGWIVLGVEGGFSEVFRSIDGEVGSNSWPFSLTGAIYNRGNGEIMAPEITVAERRSAELVNGHLPISVYRFFNEDLEVLTSLFVRKYSRIDEEGIAFYNFFIRNLTGGSKRLSFFLAVRPYLVNGQIGEIRRINYDEKGEYLRINRNYYIFFEQIPDNFGATSITFDSDITRYLIKGELPENKFSSDIKDLMNGAVGYNFKLEPYGGKNFHFKIPVGELTDLSGKIELISSLDPRTEEKREIEEWKRRLSGIKIDLPDVRYSDAFLASLSYILINMDGGMFHPSPLAYNYFWYRDSAYIIAAMLRAGFFKIAERSLPHFMDAQLKSGEFPSIFDDKGTVIGPHEWDAQGQAIFSLAEYYRFTGNRAFIERYWPNVLKCAQFLRELRKKRLTEKYRNTYFYGILPPSESAEDLGLKSWHHYWDDFWAIKGLKDAVYLGSILGKMDDVKWIEKEAQELYEATVKSAAMIMREKGMDWIPNGPEDLYSSSMARGTSPGLWPGFVLDPEDRMVKTSFRRYYEKWIEPYDGGYLHHGKFWPYGFELAYCYLLLNEVDIVHQMLEWGLEHQSFPGTYAWAEQIDPETFLFKAGDMPHSWVAADFINIVRALFVYEREDLLVLAAGMKQDWIRSGSEIRIKNFPTYFGPLSYEIEYDKRIDRLKLSLGGSAYPPDGIYFYFPHWRLSEANFELAADPEAYDVEEVKFTEKGVKIIYSRGD